MSLAPSLTTQVVNRRVQWQERQVLGHTPSSGSATNDCKPKERMSTRAMTPTSLASQAQKFMRRVQKPDSNRYVPPSSF